MTATKTTTINDTEYRVLAVSQGLKERIIETREGRPGMTNQKLIETAVAANLGDLVTALTALGFEADEAGGKVRWPFSADTLRSLREASDTTGLPALQLLRICLARHCSTATPSRSPMTAKKSTKTVEAKKPTKATKAKKTAKTAKKASRKVVVK